MSSAHTEHPCDICSHWYYPASIQTKDLVLIEDRPACDRCKLAHSVFRSLVYDLMNKKVAKRLLDSIKAGPYLRLDDDGSGRIWNEQFLFWYQVVKTNDRADPSVPLNLTIFPYSPTSRTADEICKHVVSDFTKCMEDHDCSSRSTRLTMPAFSPRRVLQLSPSGVRLLDGISVDRWACLSYCWGANSSTMKLTSQTLHTYCREIPFDALPALYQDAVKVCRWLDIQYLWIDALCIIQDEKDDWIEQAADMARIYAHGICTIAAEDASNPSHTLFSLAYESFPWSQVQGFDGMYVRETGHPFTELEHKGEGLSLRLIDPPDTPRHTRILDTRAWTYQEIELSPRIVRFTRHEIIWECYERMSRSSKLQDSFEIAPLGLSKRLCAFQAQPDWQRIVEGYSRRNLTIQSDRLPALAAVAELYGVKFRNAGRYLVGLWEEDIIRDLLWRRSLLCTQLVPRPAPASDVTSLTIPSWSWASITSPIDYWTTPEDSSALVRVLDVDVRYHGSPYLGLTTKAAITLEARYMTIKLESIGSFSMNPLADAEWKVRGAPSIQHEVFCGTYDDLSDCFQYSIDAQEDEKLIDHLVNRLESDIYLVILRATYDGYDGLLLHRRLGCSSYRRIGSGRNTTRCHTIVESWFSDNGQARGPNYWNELCDKELELIDLCLGSLPLGKFTIE